MGVAGSGVGVGGSVGVGVGVQMVGVGTAVGVTIGTGVGGSVRGFGFGRNNVHTTARIASKRKTKTPPATTQINDELLGVSSVSRGEPHSGHRKSLVTTEIFSFRYASLHPE